MSPSLRTSTAPSELASEDRIGATFARCRAQGRAALVTYVMAGDPNWNTSKAVALACLEGGADILELGFPFSDPIADGPTLQRAAERALASGTTLARCLDLAAALRAKTAVPLVLMGYLNPVLAMGVETFFARCAQSGVDGVILPDLPPEEAGELLASAHRHGVRTIFLLAPTSTDDRCARVFSAASGFVYYVSVTGVTGARTQLPRDLGARLDSLRRESPVPVVVGFGISKPEQARTLAAHADGVVVGSAIVSRAAQGKSVSERARAVRHFVGALAAALRPRRQGTRTRGS